MIAECGTCHTRYNIDERKIPPAGVKVRCKKCGNVIYIRRPSPQPAVPKTQTVPSEGESPATTRSTISKTGPPPPVVEKPPSLELPKKAEAERKAVEESVERKVHLSETQLSDEDKKWHARARRLAKALASDLVLYNKSRVEKGLKDGTLAELLGPEIRRSWDYYCQQIPKHIVDSTDYFKEQLNTIVGKGMKIFK
ncbi:MAG: zinc-ribbon domain-containing protein [candidate division WOR-3 bacterium]|nr:MAG: zinc-ribbon domain-containing protein [candidate division WOR-3 bacterium]